MGTKNTEFEFRGVNHLALVCSDMARTVDFYSGVLGMPLVKTIELPNDAGQHFFFDIGNGDCLAFFWFPDAPDAERGVSSPQMLPTDGNFVTAVGSMNHIAFNVPLEKFDEYHERLLAKGIQCSEILNHDESKWQVSRELHPGVYVRSVYFFDPDGVLLEFAAWTRTFGPDDVRVQPQHRTAVTAAAGS